MRAGARQGASRLVGIGLVALSAVSFGWLAIFARYAYQAGGDVGAVLFLRFAIAAVVMAAVMAVRRERWPRWRDALPLVALGAVGYVGQSLSYFAALVYASASLVALLLYLYPAIVTVLSVTFLGERLTRAGVVALVLAVAGSALAVGRAGSGSGVGVALGVSAAVCYSVYIVVGSRLLPRAGPIAGSTIVIASAAVVYGFAALVQRPAFPAGALGIGAVVGLALVSTVVAIVAFFAGMDRVGPTAASTVSSLEPAVTVLLAVVLLGESIGSVQLAGGALILAAVVVLARSGERVAPEPAVEGVARR